MYKMKRFISIVVTVCMLMSILSMGVFAVSISTKPADGTTTGQPFAAGTGGSKNFRIPGIVTLDNGTLIAACDARWNHSGDGAGLDTIVSVSTDNGENWTYTYANYLGDNGDTYNNLSTCFIDPGIGTDGTTAYLIADLWPAGIALNTSKYSPVAGKTGYDANGNLALRDASQDTVQIGDSGYNRMAANAAYDYYLDLQTLTLHKNDGTAVEGYTVDAYFNIKGEGVDTNLFFSDSPFQPYPTDYLYMTTSTDGLTWSEPQLLNLKEASEQTLLIGPGNGTYDAVNDRMIFTGYEHSSGYERASLIWMDGEGNWYRSEDATVDSWSSEATSVVLDDGTVRTFYRDGYTTLRYTDYVFDEELNNYVRAAYEVDTGVAIDSGCQLTSILHSQQVDGKDLVLVAGPTSSRRINGYIYAFLVSEDNSMELAYAYNVTPDFYAYSCLTELADGTIGLLYESAGSALTFVTYDFDEIITRDNDPRLTVKEIELYEGYSEVINDSTGYYVDADISELDTTVATLTMTGEEITTNAAKVLGTGANIDLDSCQYTFTLGEDGYYEVSATTLDGETVYLNHFSTTANSIPNVTAPAGKIAILDSSYENMFKLQAQVIEGSGSGAARGLHFHMEYEAPYWNRCGNDSSVKCHEYLFRKAAAGETASAEIPGYVLITSKDEVVDGGQYLIAAKNDAGNWFVLNPSTSGEKFNHVAQIMGSTTVGRTELTFTGVGKGYTEVVVGTTIYKLTVHGANDIYLDVGESKVVVDETGYYVDADLSALDTAVATVELTGEITGYENVLSENVAEIESGKTYVLYNKAARKLMGNEWADASVGGGGTDGLALDSTLSNYDENDLWTVTATEGGFYVQDQAGKYLSIARGKGQVKDEAVVINLDFDGTDWTIGENGEYANDFGGAHSAVAGWSDINDTNSQWEIYEVSKVALGTTTITFTGVGEGTTSVQIGNEIYEITVTEPYIDPADDSRDIPLDVLEVSTGDYEKNGMQYNEGPAYFAVDDDPNSLWHTDWYGTSRENHWFQFELTEGYTVDGLRYWPRQAGNTNGTITAYEIQVSNDGENFRTVASGEWENNRQWKLAKFDGENVKYVRLVAVDAITDNQYVFASASEIRITGVKAGELPHEHAFGEWTTTKEATCTEEGSRERVCECGEKETEVIAALGHDYVAEFIEPTCTKSGYTLYTCSRCGHSYKDDPVEPEHKFDEGTVTAPTCTEQGYTTYTCLVCGEKYVDEASWTDALGHTAAEAVKENEKAATCTETGSYDLVVYCSVCNEELSRETVTVDALGHTEEVIPGKAPTCTETGLTEGKKCSVCGEITVAQEEIPALGHEYVNGDCSRCDAVLESKFEDVEAGDFFFDPVAWAVEKGVTTGATATTFN
ncbi:MAG: discoidin domain-containing protein, partial [Oscillospiraceae bacterium]|nr:discoidin domain-containing protein [Oscillospiraceae bacterium]